MSIDTIPPAHKPGYLRNAARTLFYRDDGITKGRRGILRAIAGGALGMYVGAGAACAITSDTAQVRGRLGGMRRFRSWDGTELAYRRVGAGPPLVCIPGGPGQAVEYLGELGGLSEHRELILLDNRGTGASHVPLDPTTYRVDRLVQDVEALRGELGLEQIDLFGHSASGGICLLYLAQHPHRLRHLVLVAPSLRVVGIQSDLGVDEVLAKRMHEPWYAEAVAALYAEAASPQELQRYRWLSAPLLYGQWNAAAQVQAAAEPAQFAKPATDGFYAGFDPAPALQTRLASITVPVLVVAGEYDIWPTSTAVRELVALFRNANMVVMPRVGHFPWVDDPATFAATVQGFLVRGSAPPAGEGRNATADKSK